LVEFDSPNIEILRLTMMEKLTVDAEGKIVIPPEVIQKRGLHPGDELTLVESAEGLLVYQGGVDEKTLAWWNRLDDRQRLLAEDYARRDENLSEHERDAFWNQEPESIEIEAESDELDLPTN
jgi:bifunctional DNA-binding transcriptional regulator/antitoxin component of YhaV-PrlF toxin-antitoxin module